MYVISYNLTGSTIELLLRVEGGGKRGRTTTTSTVEKVLLAEHALQGAIRQLPSLGMQVFDDMVKQALGVVEAMNKQQDETFVLKTIESMSEEKIKGVKEMMKTNQITERRIAMLGIFFIEELNALQKLRIAMERIEAVLEAVFLVQLIRSYWTPSRGGELNIQKLRVDVDARIKVFEILAKHGNSMNVG